MASPQGLRQYPTTREREAIMAKKFQFAPAGQVNLSAYKVNTVRKRGRNALIVRARKFVDTITLTDGTTRNVAFFTEKGKGVALLTGGARIVSETLYELYVRSPEDSIRGAIKWALDEAPELLAHDDFDLGLHRGAISKNAYALGAEYFEASMSYALDEQQKAAQQRKRAEDFRRGTVGEAIGPRQAEALKGAASTVKPASKAPTPRDIARRVHVHV